MDLCIHDAESYSGFKVRLGPSCRMRHRMSPLMLLDHNMCNMWILLRWRLCLVSSSVTRDTAVYGCNSRYV